MKHSNRKNILLFSLGDLLSTIKTDLLSCVFVISITENDLKCSKRWLLNFLQMVLPKLHMLALHALKAVYQREIGSFYWRSHQNGVSLRTTT